MKLAIVMATYQRKDGKTPFFLQRAIDSVFAQKHRDWRLFIVGDHYENQAELDALIPSYRADILSCINLEKAVEREKYRDNKEYLWNNGGVNAYTVATEQALTAGFDYICFLDHDDYWLPNHLQVISEAIEFTKADWLCTRAQCPDGVLPRIHSTEYLVPFLPLPAGVIKSSVCYNHRTIPLRLRDAGALPADYDLWQRMASYMTDNNLVGYYINKITCIYEKAGYERN